MNCNLRDMLFSYMGPLLDVHISLEQAYIKILAYLKLLKMMYAILLEFDVYLRT